MDMNVGHVRIADIHAVNQPIATEIRSKSNKPEYNQYEHGDMTGWSRQSCSGERKEAELRTDGMNRQDFISFKSDQVGIATKQYHEVIAAET